jgi:hypothetical protein
MIPAAAGLAEAIFGSSANSPQRSGVRRGSRNGKRMRRNSEVSAGRILLGRCGTGQTTCNPRRVFNRRIKADAKSEYQRNQRGAGGGGGSLGKPVSSRNSLLTGKRTGNFEKAWLSSEESSVKHTQNQSVGGQFPKILNREFFRANRERRTRKRSEQGMSRATNYMLYESARARNNSYGDGQEAGKTSIPVTSKSHPLNFRPLG